MMSLRPQSICSGCMTWSNQRCAAALGPHRPVRRRGTVAAAAHRAAAPAPAPAPPAPRAAAAAGAALAAAAALLLAPLAAPPRAAAGANLLDVPACADFKPATAPGVKFCDVRRGGGESPLEGDLVMVDYTARALAAGGKVFDGSRQFKFEVGANSPDTTQASPARTGGAERARVMSGFDLAILGDGGALPPIKEGGVRTVVLPPALAYGAKGDGCLYGLDGSCRIPPNSEVELTFRYLGRK
ncbi:MAG: hypothetical protein J3K34DRAFT_455687 [Monoraphidium minutum]|nr:MAG: hypothetical protein J3K34DRAFT_455687 [Monoraphidium minutum]